jgi:hypothetical protein
MNTLFIPFYVQACVLYFPELHYVTSPNNTVTCLRSKFPYYIIKKLKKKDMHFKLCRMKVQYEAHDLLFDRNCIIYLQLSICIKRKSS